jgi:hypothetical protein
MGDHIIFEECIASMFNYLSGTSRCGPDAKIRRGCVLLDFRLKTTLVFCDIRVLPSVEIQLKGPYRAFVSPIEFGRLDPFFDGVRESIAVSTVLAFATQHVVRAPRGFLFTSRERASQLDEIAIHFPVLTAGPGCNVYELEESREGKFSQDFEKTFGALQQASSSDFAFILRVLRLLQLANENLRSDFSLAYALLVASIESVAQKAVSRKHLRETHPSEEKWQERSRSDPEFSELYRAYKEQRGRNQYLKARFVEFVMEYCPIGKWSDLEHPASELAEYLESVTGRQQDNWIMDTPWYEARPEGLTDEQARAILAEVYGYRSMFIHQGAPPPNRDPASSNHFFELIHEVAPNGTDIRSVVVPSFRLLQFIGRRAIGEYLGLLAQEES